METKVRNDMGYRKLQVHTCREVNVVQEHQQQYINYDHDIIELKYNWTELWIRMTNGVPDEASCKGAVSSFY